MLNTADKTKLQSGVDVFCFVLKNSFHTCNKLSYFFVHKSRVDKRERSYKRTRKGRKEEDGDWRRMTGEVEGEG